MFRCLVQAATSEPRFGSLSPAGESQRPTTTCVTLQPYLRSGRLPVNYSRRGNMRQLAFCAFTRYQYTDILYIYIYIYIYVLGGKTLTSMIAPFHWGLRALFFGIRLVSWCQVLALLFPKGAVGHGEAFEWLAFVLAEGSQPVPWFHEMCVGCCRQVEIRLITFPFGFLWGGHHQPDRQTTSHNIVHHSSVSCKNM